MMYTWAMELVMDFEGLVELRLLRLACKCPIGVASDSGEYFLICLVVNSGKVVRNPAAIACASVERVIEKILAL